jgi:hypothetical protein
MKATAALVVALLLIGVSARAWDGPASNKSTSELEQMTDPQLINEGLSACIKAGEQESAAIDYLRTVAGVARARHPDYAHPEFSDMLAAAAAENARLCRKAAKAGIEREGVAK